MVFSENHPELAKVVNRAEVQDSNAPKAIKQHKTNVTAKFIADKMVATGKTLIGKTYTIEEAHRRFVSADGVESQSLSGVQAFVAGTQTKNSIFSQMKKEAKKYKYWSHQWRAAIIEKDYEDAFERELKKSPKEGFILLHPKNPFDVGGHEKALGKWYDPVLQKTYDEVDWAKRADGFIPELKTSIEVKTTTSTTAVQNKGLNTENFSNYDGIVGYAKVVVWEQKTTKSFGMDEQRIKHVARRLAEGLDFWGNQSKAQLERNAKKWEKFQRGKTDFVYDVRVENVFTSLYEISTIANVIKAKLQKLGLESGKPLPEQFVNNVNVSGIDIITVLVDWLHNASLDPDFFGILYVESDLQKMSKESIKNVISSVIKVNNKTGVVEPNEILMDALTIILKSRENAELFMKVAKSTNKIHWSPQVQMGASYERQYALKDLDTTYLGTSEYRP